MSLKKKIFNISRILVFASVSFLLSCTKDNPITTEDNRTMIVSPASTTYIEITGLENGQLYEFTVAGSSTETVITGFSSYVSNTIKIYWRRGLQDVGKDTIYFRKTNSTTPSPGYFVWAPTQTTMGTNPN